MPDGMSAARPAPAGAAAAAPSGAAPPAGLRARGFAYVPLLAAAMLAPLGVLAVGAWLAWGQVWREAETELARTAEAAGEYAARLLDGHLLLADRVDDLLQGLPDERIRAREAELHAALHRMAAARPSVLTLYAIDAEGRPLVSASLSPIPRDATLADRDFFEALRSAAAPGVFISKVHVGRFDGQLFFSVARRRGPPPAPGDDAAPREVPPFRGVVLASLRPGEVAAGLNRLADRPGDRITLIRTDGEILARSTGFDRPLPPVPASNAPRQRMAAGAERGFARGRSPLDGAERVAAQWRVEGWPIYAAASRPRAAIVARWRETVAWQAAAAVPAALGLLGLALFASRRARDLAEARTALRTEAERRTGAAALADSEARLQRALAAGQVFAFEWNPATDEVLRSASCGPILGIAEAGAATRDTRQAFFDRIHSDDRDRFVAATTGLTPAAPAYVVSYRYRRPDGSTAWLKEMATARFGPDGRMAHLSGLTRDVTAEAEAEAALHTAEERLRLAQTAGGVGTWDWDLRTGLVTCSEGYCRLYGLDPAGPGHPDSASWLAQVHPEDRDRVRAMSDAGVASGQYETEYRIVRADGAVRWIVARGTTQFDAEGRPTRFLGVNVDITALREAEQRLRAATEGAGLGVYEFDFARGAAWFDTHAAAMLDGVLPAERWVPLDGPEWASFAERIHPDDRGKRDAAFAAASEGTTDGLALECRVRRRAAAEGWSWIWCHGTTAERDPASGRARRLIGVVQDVTERHRLEDDLRQAQKLQALGELAGGIAHDFNNVLQAVASGAAQIERDAAQPGAVRRRARMVAEAAGRGASITRRLLTFARRGELRAEAVDAAALLRGLREILKPTLGPRIDVQVGAETGLPPLLADRAQLGTALINLATNARDAMGPDGGVLSLSAMAERVTAAAATPEAGGGGAAARPARLAPGHYIRLVVRDTGAGMDAATLARVAEPFFTTKRAGEGTGLGLPMAKGFAEQSGGALAIESAPGQGTIVTLWLPQAGPEEIRAVPRTSTADPNATGAAPAAEVPSLPPPLHGVTAAGADPAGARPRILVVDDEPMVRETLADDLEAAGFAVLAAACGAEALARLDAGETMDALVTDLTMPGLDGLTLIREARLRRPGLPAVLLTGAVGDAAALAAGGAVGGPFALLRKPMLGADLAKRIAALLEEASAEA